MKDLKSSHRNRETQTQTARRANGAPTSPIAGTERGARKHQIRLLIVDDEGMVRAIVERALRSEGYATTTVSDGAEALQVAAQLGPFDAMITDVQMPQMCGDELARRLRQVAPDLRVLYLTAHIGELFKSKKTFEPGESFLEKPCSVQAIRQAVRSLVCGLGGARSAKA